MQRPFRLPPITAKRQRSTDLWVPEYDDGCIVNDCPPIDDWDEQVLDGLEASAISFDPDTAFVLDQMPVVRYNDDDFQTWLRGQINICDHLRETRKQCLFPWEIQKALPNSRTKGKKLYLSQGQRPSCAMHAAVHARHGSLLTSIALGSPHVYDPTNPIYTFWLAKGQSYRGGMNLAPLATAVNTLGNYPISLVGDDNINADAKKAKEFADAAAGQQSGIVLLPTENHKVLADAIIRCIRAGLGVAIGNGLRVVGVETDRNGMKIVTLRGGWSHATSFIVYWVVNGVEYILWVNSHGPRYKQSRLGEPADCAWMTRALLEEFCKTAKNYGTPFAVLPKSIVLTSGMASDNMIRVPYPNSIA